MKTVRMEGNLLFPDIPETYLPQRSNKGGHHKKLDQYMATEIKTMYKMGWSAAELAKIYKTTEPNIYFIVKEQTWKHVRTYER